MNEMMKYSTALYGDDAIHPLRALKTFERYQRLDVWSSSLSDSHLNALKIVDKHLKGDRDILMCQDELIEAGLAQWAVL